MKKWNLKIVILLLVISSLLCNCQKEYKLIQQQTAKKETLFRTYTHNKIQIEKNINLLNKLKLSQKIFSQRNKNKSVYSDVYDFTIKTKLASYVESEDGNYHSYTFPIVRTIDNGLTENFILSLQNDGSYKAFIASYDLSEQDINNIRTNSVVNFENKSILTEVTNDYLINIVDENKSCSWESITFCSTTITYFHNWPFSEENCNTFHFYYCDDPDIQFPNIDTDEYGVLDNNTSNNYDGGFVGSGMITNPVNTDLLNWNAFRSNLDKKLISIVNNLIINGQAYDYLVARNFSDDAQNIIETAFYEIYNGVLIEFEELVSVLEQEDYYKSRMSNDELNIFNSINRIKQLGYLQSAYNAEAMMNSLYPTNINNPCSQYNGQGDAFRHSLWNALSTVRIGESLTEQLTTAHESRPAPLGYDENLYNKEKQMDLYNNARGRELAYTSGLVVAAVISAKENGNLRYLSNLNSNNCRATLNSFLIHTN